ncbi:hypothetical protein ACTTAF_17480 [Rhodobacter capsulatus]|uniref:hypothetical protein n=1 Tax=Rhodobacter capsulatus TaxID=1061 RepID=UPI0003D376C8|nr:hypothetical protein [Rhodobacter capsulatus]ETD85846.1 hypothetical protein U703_01900 [Rhodobacter capsulatus YW1]
MTKHPGSVDNLQQTATEVTLGDDLLHGADAIARFMFGDAKHRRKVYYLTGEAPRGMPHFKMGSVICARKSTLLNWIAQQERFTPGE